MLIRFCYMIFVNAEGYCSTAQLMIVIISELGLKNVFSEKKPFFHSISFHNFFYLKIEFIIETIIGNRPLDLHNFGVICSQYILDICVTFTTLILFVFFYYLAIIF